MAKATVDAAKEAKAIETCGKAFTPLNTQGRRRVLQWLIDSYGTDAEGAASRAPARDQPAGTRRAPRIEEDSSFEDFFDQKEPKSDVHRALVAAYWLQFRGEGGAEGFTPAEVNALLGEIGHDVTNIANAFVNLRAKKKGKGAFLVYAPGDKSKKRHRVTPAGRKIVEAMVAGNSNGKD
ncbi:MAG: hypothetical protein KF819_01645 [Labilithrix sp.]|nr:hypothetical protein [Labilithrix sp.]